MTKAKSPFRSIPSTGTSIEEIREQLDAMKENLEILQGHRGARGTSSQIFYVDPKSAQDIPEGTNDGDLWIQSPTEPGGQRRISVWKDGKWT